MKILLYGYYFNNNLGDDLFEYVFSKYLSENNIDYIIYNPQQLYSINNGVNIDAILIGGGEIINEYFLFPIFKLFQKLNNWNIPIYGASIGSTNQLIKFTDFFDKCIFRNNISIINDIDYFYDNDIIHSIDYKNIIPEDLQSISNTIGYYLIDNINTEQYNLLINFTNHIKSDYTINFVVFDTTKDLSIINNIIKDCNLSNYTIIIKSKPLDILIEIFKNEKHLCLRYHAHVLCYLFKKQFNSIPLTQKTIYFNNKYNIPYSLNLTGLLYLFNAQNITFNNLKFNFNNLKNILNNNNNIIKNKKESIWYIIFEIYSNFLNIILHKNNNVYNKLDYICDQIEFNFIGNFDTIYRHGLKEKLYNLYNDYNSDSHVLQKKFVTIITNIVF